MNEITQVLRNRALHVHEYLRGKSLVCKGAVVDIDEANRKVTLLVFETNDPTFKKGERSTFDVSADPAPTDQAVALTHECVHYAGIVRTIEQAEEEIQVAEEKTEFSILVRVSYADTSGGVTVRKSRSMGTTREWNRANVTAPALGQVTGPSAARFAKLLLRASQIAVNLDLDLEP